MLLETRVYGFDQRHTLPSGEALPYANVTIAVEPDALVAEARRLRAALVGVGVEVPEMGPEEGAVAIQATYDSGNDIAILALYGVDDAALAAASTTAGT